MTDRAARRWFELAFASSPNGMLLVDGEGDILLVNDAAEKMFGWREHELIGCDIDLLIAPASRRKLLKLRNRAIDATRRKPVRSDVELVGRHRDGREFPIGVGIGGLHGDDRSTVLVSIVDFTRRKRQENRILGQNNVLRDAVAERNAALEASNARLQAEIEERRRTERELRATQKRLQETNEELRRLALVDELTGLSNRRHFEARFQVECQRAARARGALAVVMLDIDHFKEFNDRAGHQAGDECLRRVSRAVASCLRRPADLIARWGGEELVALLPETSRDGAAQLARNMRAAVRALAIPHPGSPFGVVTVSAGVASRSDSAEFAPAKLLEAADRALYSAKARGRDRVCIAMAAERQAKGADAAQAP